MIETIPEVRLIASPRIHWGALSDAVDSFGGQEWRDRVQEERMSDAETLVEYAGRRCYRSWAPGLNPNVTKVREDSAEYLENVIKSRHGSVLEHVNFTFDFDQVSRVFCTELIRHRAGVAISQESLRYVRLDSIGLRIPEVLRDGPDLGHGDAAMSMEQAVIEIVERLEDFQVEAAEAYGLDDPNVSFAYKKEVTSALRRLAPMGLSTGIVWSANARTLRHVIEMRTAASAEEEIRYVFDQVARIMTAECPALFADFHPLPVKGSDIPVWMPGYSKV